MDLEYFPNKIINGMIGQRWINENIMWNSVVNQLERKILPFTIRFGLLNQKLTQYYVQ
jgi:hypothetical protein